MLENPFPVPSLCKLNLISVCFIQIHTKITCKQLIPFRESNVFFEVIPGVFGCSVTFNITQRFLLRQSVFQTIFPFLVTMLECIKGYQQLIKERKIKGITQPTKTWSINKSKGLLPFAVMLFSVNVNSFFLAGNLRDVCFFWE